MKTIATIIIFLLTTNLALANEIDNLRTEEDVQKFLAERVNEKWKNIPAFKI